MTDWPQVALKRVMRLRNGEPFAQVENDEGTYPVYGSGGPFARADDYLAEGPSVLFGRKGTVDRPLLVDGRFWCIDTMFYTSLSSAVEPRFAHYFAMTIPYDLLSTNTALPSVTQSDLGEVMMPLPPLPQQLAIADFLDRETAQIDAMIEAQETVVALAQEHRSSLIASEIESLSSRYPQVALRHCVVVQNGVTLGKDFGPDADEYPYLRVANVQSGYLDLEVIKTVRVSAAVAAGSTLRPGDVLITEGGDRAALGRGALWEGQIPDALHQNHIFALRCRKTLNPRYLVYVLDAPAARAYFESTRRQTTNLSSTNASKVRAFAVPLPDVEHQREVVARLDAGLDRLAQVIAAAQDVLSLLRERREALITAAVTGRIDPHTGIERLEDAS